MMNPTDKDLFYAILSMDAYNRGYNSGIDLKGSTLGNALISLDAEDEGFLDAGAAQSAGFYAVAYKWNGETIISYRGDEPRICIRTCQAFLKLGLIFFEASKLKPQKRHKKGAVKAP